jgi:hypothetical protein
MLTNEDISGRVQNGKLELEHPLGFPDGTPVRVHIELRRESLAECLKDVIGKIEGLPPDYARNHEHYLYGTPKQEDE